MSFLMRAFGRLLPSPKGPGPATKVRILLKQISSKQHQHVVGLRDTSTIEWDISIYCGDAESVRIVSLLDPSIPTSEGNLRWYLEEFVITSPFDRSRSHSAVTELKTYAERLINGLNLQAPLQQLRSKLHLSEGTPLTVFLDIEAATASTATSIHNLHWEVLEDMSVWPEKTNHQIIVRRKVPDLNIVQSVQTKGNVSGFNILLVVARDLSRGDDEIGHTLTTAGMVEIIGKLPSKTPVNLEIVRPGTWDTLKRHLESRPKGYFSIVHLDMPGRVNTGTKSASLCFISDLDYMKVTWKSSKDVATLLNKHQVPSVILNACNSADTSGEIVALTLINHGVSSVVAISYKFLAEASRLFMSGFYRSLLVDMSSFAIAAYKGRKRLLDKNLRESGYNFRVPLEDHIVPVLYQRENVCPLVWGKMAKKESVLVRYVDAPAKVVGRELDILRLEIGLLTNSNVLPITGKRGVGKTTLLKHLGWWWSITSLIERFHYIDLSESTDSFNQMLIKLHQFTGGWAGPKSLSELLDTPVPLSPRQSKIYIQVVQYMRQARHLLVIDGIELWEPEAALIATDETRYRNCQRQIMKDFLEDLRGGKSFVIATVGLNQTWFGWTPYILEGLDSVHMRYFMPIDSESVGAVGCDGPDAEFWEFYGKILEFIGGIPGVLRYFTFVLPITAESNPKEIYLSMLRIIPGYDGPYTEESLCYRLVKKLKEFSGGDPDTFNLLCCLAPFQGRLPIDMKLYLVYLSVNSVFSGRLNLYLAPQSELEVCSAKLATSALLVEHKRLIQYLIKLDFLTPDETRPDLYYAINPILALALRKVMWGQGDLTDNRVSWLITSGFYDYYRAQGNPINQDLALNHRGYDSRIQLEKASIFSLMLSLLEQKNLLPLLGILPVPLYLHLVLDSSTFTALGPDSFFIKAIASLAIGQFNRLREEEVALEDIMVLYLFAYQCSNILCAFFADRGSDEFQKQVAMSNEFTELGKTMSITARHSVLFLDFHAATLTADAARARRSQTSHDLFYTAGEVCPVNFEAAEMHRTNPRLIDELVGDVASGIEPFKRLFRLQKQFREKNNSWTPNEEKQPIQAAVRACCDALRRSGAEHGLESVFVDSWMAEFEASIEIIPYSAAVERIAVAETASGNALPTAAVANALRKRDAGDLVGAREGLLAALTQAQDDASPEREYVCQTNLSELSYVTQEWADSIAHTTESLKLIDIVKTSETESKRLALRASCRGQNAVCYARLGLWDQAIAEELFILHLCRQNKDDEVLGEMHYDALVFLKYLIHKSGREEIMSSEDNKRERYKVLLEKENFTTNSDEERRGEEARSMFCLVTILSPKLQMKMLAQAVLDGIPIIDGVPLFVPVGRSSWWEGVPDDDEFTAEMKSYCMLSFTDPESTFYRMEPGAV